MTKFYIYSVDTKEVIAIAEGDTHQECADKALNYLGVNKYGGTYTPAFGFENGLIENPDAEIL